MYVYLCVRVRILCVRARMCVCACVRACACVGVSPALSNPHNDGHFHFQFIGHKNCQQVLQSLWTHHHPDVMWMSYVRLVVHFVPRILALPFIYALYFVFPCAPIYRTWRSPIMRFIGDTVSYLVFLALLVTTVARGRERSGLRVPDLQV